MPLIQRGSTPPPRPPPHSSTMAARGAFLAPLLLPLPSCFVNLPPAFIDSFIGARDASSGATILELSWETLDGYVQRVCVGWIGGVTRAGALRSDTFEISAEFARCVGLQDHLQRMPQAFIGVHVVNAVPAALQVNVEPCTEDDWELIQLHAGRMESEFLRQICVVNDQQVHPIWIHQNVVIRIRVALPVGMEFARLAPNSEVIVAPKERKPITANPSLDPEFYFEASPPLRVQLPQLHITVPEGDVWVHPETFAALDGALKKQATNGMAVVALWKETKTRGPSIPAQEDVQLNAAPLCAVGRLKVSSGVARGRVMVGAAVAALAATTAHSRVHIRVLRLPEVGLRRVVFKSTQEKIADISLSDVLVRVNETSEPVIFQDGSLISLQMDEEKTLQCVVDVAFDVSLESEELEQQLTNVPTGALTKYALVGGILGSSLDLERVEIGVASPQQAHLMEGMGTEDSHRNTYDASLEKLARDAPAYQKTAQAIRTIVYRDESVARVMLGVKTPGSVVMYGDRGSGKTTMLRSLGDELARDPLSLATPIYVECRSLRGLKMETVKGKLSEAFEEAATYAPSIVLLDNLDALVPEENDQAGPANDQSRRIAEHLISLMQHARDRMWKTTLELNSSVKAHLKTIKATAAANPSEAQLTARALFEGAGSAMLLKSVAVISTSRSDASLHKALRTTGLFDRPIQVMAPNAEQRESIIRDVLELKLEAATQRSSCTSRELDSAIDFGLLASMTEGYSLRDLANVADRTLHQFFIRSSRASSDAGAPLRLVQADYTQALDGFQPTALVGVDLFKSSVQWADVGGLTTVRNVLKDTLELPTRYAKLYDQAPIKLPAGMLLYGPPGCGKTLLASAVASECGLNFISVKGPEVLNKYIGASEQAIRDLFARAASAAPSVLFLDEFDSIAPRRGADNTGVTDRLVNQLLTFLDGVESRKGVYVLAATSRPDMIDPALLRPGRLDKSLYCGFPTEAERLDILRAVGRNMELDDEAHAYLADVAASPKSRLFSGADLQALMYSAQLELVHEKLSADTATPKVILKRHVETAFRAAKPSTSEAKRREFDAMYASFSKARNTDFSVADADNSPHSEELKAHLQHQRTALA